jgi:hypothetical protein
MNPDQIPDGFFSLGNPTFLAIMLRFATNLIFMFILIRVVYYRYNKKMKFLFTFFMMGIVVFFICSMLGAVRLDISFAFGLFAIFAILRFRTRNVGIKDMAYIFTTIGISMINSLKVFKFPLLGIFIFNILIILSSYFLEEYLARHRYESHVITYNNTEMLKPENKQKLLQEVSDLTGEKIFKVKILKVDYKKGEASLEVYYNC